MAKLIEDCTTCRKLHASNNDQKMVDLPKERIETSSLFVYSAVDYFGRYGVLFTCLASRAIDLEVSDTLKTDSFLNTF